MVQGPDGHRWLRMNMSVRQRFSFLPGVGYAFGLGDRQTNHLLVQVAFGATLYGNWSLYKSQTRMARVTGHGAYLHLGAELAIPVHPEAVSTHVAFPLRLQQVFAFGRHALLLVTSVGPRWDLLPGEVGLQVTLGVGYTLILPPAGIPLLVEAVHQSYGAYGRGAWGLRLMMSWPLSW